MQILAGILLEAVDGKLNLAATDMELSLRTSLEAQVGTDGRGVVAERLLLELARLLPDSEVTLEHKVEEAAVEIRCGTATYHLHTSRREDFPRLPGGDAFGRHEIERESFPRRGRAGQPLRVARRVAPGADRRSDAVRARKARDGRDQIPTAYSVKETPLEGTVPELEAIEDQARALGELSPGSRRPARRSSWAFTRTRSSSQPATRG